MRRLRDHHLAFAITALASFAGIVYLRMNVTGSDPQNLRGLTQRIFSLINFLWLAPIAFLHLWPTETQLTWCENR